MNYAVGVLWAIGAIFMAGGLFQEGCEVPAMAKVAAAIIWPVVIVARETSQLVTGGEMGPLCPAEAA